LTSFKEGVALNHAAVQHILQHEMNPLEDNMNTTKKTINQTVSAAAAEKAEVVETIATLYTNGVERLAEVQKTGIDLGMKQNAELLTAWKKIANVFPGAPGLVMLDLVSSALDRYADTQKGAIDLVLEQSHALANLVKERATSNAAAIDGAAAVLQQTIEHAVATQKKALDNSVAQSKAAFETAKKQFGLTGTPVEAAAESFQRGVDSLIETQKELLDIAAKPFASVQ
jgi:hypothetical protein